MTSESPFTAMYDPSEIQLMEYLVRGLDNVKVSPPPSGTTVAGTRVTAVKCNEDGCSQMHRRANGYCAEHETRWRKLAEQEEEEETLLPGGCEPTFIDMTGYGIVRNGQNARHALFMASLRCEASGCAWTVYRRYEEFQVSSF
jgi:hypothetical protein